MGKATRIGARAGLLAGVLLLAIACEDGTVVAPADGTLSVSLNPTALTVDANDPANAQKTSDVRAILVDKDGVPVEDATVFFSATDGQLMQSGVVPFVPLDSATTNAQGVARATLVVTADDADEIDVTATSGALSDTETLVKGIVGEQRPPTASFTIEPCGTPCAGDVNRTVTFRSTATDPNAGDTLTYRWKINSTLDASDETVVTTSTRLNRTYAAAQDLNVVMDASDDPTASASSPESVWDDSTAKDYKICGNRAPVAVAPADVSLSGVNFPRTVSLDGRGSSDPDGDNLTYQWACGNGQSGGTASIGSCTYTAAGSFTVTMTVTDAPNGCATKTSTDVSLVVLSAEP
jgi:hypothetical protein